MTDPVPDPSRPLPSLGDVFKAFTPAATDPDALMKALKALKASQMPPVSSRQLSDAITSTADMRWCGRCKRPEPRSIVCPEARVGWVSVDDAKQPRMSSMVLPDDPFTAGAESGIAARVLYDDMLSAGIPLSSVENIIGCMLAALIRDAPMSEES